MIKPERIAELVAAPYDRTRPEVPGDVFGERRLLAQLLSDDPSKKPTAAMLKLAGAILKDRLSTRISDEDLDRIAQRVVRVMRAGLKPGPPPKVKVSTFLDAQKPQPTTSQRHLVENPFAATIEKREEWNALCKRLNWYPGKNGRPPREIVAFKAALRAR